MPNSIEALNHFQQNLFKKKQKKKVKASTKLHAHCLSTHSSLPSMLNITSCLHMLITQSLRKFTCGIKLTHSLAPVNYRLMPSSCVKITNALLLTYLLPKQLFMQSAPSCRWTNPSNNQMHLHSLSLAGISYFICHFDCLQAILLKTIAHPMVQRSQLAQQLTLSFYPLTT